jgi:uncharacterized membrane protein
MINWGALLAVQLVSLGATLAVVTLVAVAVLGLSARGAASTPGRHTTTFSARSGTAVGAICLALATAIVLFGLWQIVAR